MQYIMRLADMIEIFRLFVQVNQIISSLEQNLVNMFFVDIHSLSHFVS